VRDNPSWSTHLRSNAPSWMMVSVMTRFQAALNITCGGALDRRCVDHDGNKSPLTLIVFDLRVFAASWFKRARQILSKKQEFTFKRHDSPPGDTRVRPAVADCSGRPGSGATLPRLRLCLSESTQASRKVPVSIGVALVPDAFRFPFPQPDDPVDVLGLATDLL